ncbi:serine/threonine-protein kinase [Limnofasciculus baicalensis]|uniref:non-specific serine/threonine protein kinase n=1 Tax=Limnofasciculus baicalensis BBK-W-15 TaxID=2699891 RepID=A0AAE3GQ28_9CYAN|nr:serine/threonine-protein kinase [Limnofasciculus baicalensis]MCP2727823.1 serine/threonine protein kinase [Limnofasciculus baicalensis BBK-W-15]
MNILENRYKVIRVLGSGGFGDTFLAEDAHLPSGRHCVVKQLKPQTNDPQVYQIVKDRFQREAVILEDLGQQSNQIPSLYAYFESGGQFYLVQELIEGITLGKMVQKQGTLSDSAVRGIMTGILPVLEYVHSQRIVHRDIKPDNIIIRNADNQPVLIDFGAVKETMGTTVSSSGNSSRSIVIGTPGFMPYEQTAGRPVFASDLYSLGLTAIYLLTGKFPQELETDPQTGEILWRRYALSVSPTLGGVLDKAIQFHSRDRYNTPREMLDALRIGVTAIPSPTPTIISPPPVGVVNQPTTVISANPVSTPFPPQPTSSTVAAAGLTDWQKAIITGSVIGVFVLGALVVTRPKTTEGETKEAQVQQSQSPQIITSPTQVNTQPVQAQPSNNSSPVQAQPPSPQIANISSSKSSPIGWLRLGAVKNTSGNAYFGETLIATTQIVTIAPTQVPSVGEQVTIITGVNLRNSFPQPPDYKLPEKVSVLQPGQKLVIHSIKTFTDPTTPSPYTVVWAEVGLP